MLLAGIEREDGNGGGGELQETFHGGGTLHGRVRLARNYSP
jgi:hypothetical protein